MNQTMEEKPCCAAAKYLEPAGPLLVRLALGLVFLAHGSQKLFGAFGGHGWSATIGSFHDKMGVPVFFAALAIIAEFFGGLGVLVGLFTRVAAFGIFCVMTVAVTQVHFKNGFFADKGGFEYPLALGLAALSLVLSGGGKWSLDALICRWWRK